MAKTNILKEDPKKKNIKHIQTHIHTHRKPIKNLETIILSKIPVR